MLDYYSTSYAVTKPLTSGLNVQHLSPQFQICRSRSLTVTSILLESSAKNNRSTSRVKRTISRGITPQFTYMRRRKVNRQSGLIKLKNNIRSIESSTSRSIRIEPLRMTFAKRNQSLSPFNR